MRTTLILLAVAVLLVTRDAQSRPLRDPLLDAIVEHESRGQANAVGGLHGQCIGLTQICLHTVAACREGGFESADCLAEKRRLLDPGENLRTAVSRLQSWRKLCKRTVGHAGVREIVFGFAGGDGRGVHCGRKLTSRGWVKVKAPKAVREILDLYARKKRAHR